MPRLSRLRLVGIGHPSARFDDLLLDLRDADGHATDTTLWLRNGGGKSSLLNLFFALLRPDRREFLGNRAEAKQRRLEDYVLKSDHSFVAAEWELDGESNADPASTPNRLITGVFYEWRGASGVEAGQLRRLFFSARTSNEKPALGLSDLPAFIETPTGRRRRTLTSFRDAWAELRMRHPHLELSHTENHREWKESLEAVGLDPEIFAYQIKMNQREGGADEVFRFADHEQFADFLLELVLDPAFGDRVATNIGTFREELRLRKNSLLPEIELISGLRTRLDPLAGVARHRDEVRRNAADIRQAVLGLGVHLSTRADMLAGEAAAREEESRQAAAAAGEARERALAEKRTAAAYRLFAAERRRDAVSVDLESARRTLTTAQRQVKLWTAAVPLAQALHHETAAAAALHQLEAKRAEHVPDLRLLAHAATDFAGALERAAAERLEVETTARNAAASSRSTALTTRNSAAAHRARAAACHERARSLESQIARATEARSRLERDTTLAPGEPADAAIARLSAEIQSHRDRAQALGAHEEALGTDISQRRADRERLVGEATRIKETARQERQRLESATAERTAIEADASLRRELSLEELDVERLPDSVFATLDDAARMLTERVIETRLDAASDERALQHLEENGLLPPSRDVEQMVVILRARLAAAWSGWAYIEANVPDQPGARRKAVAAAPELALGVIVRDSDFEKAVQILNEAGAAPEWPTLVAPQSAFVGATTRRGVVLGPGSDAWYDRNGAARELLARRARVSAHAAAIRDYVERRESIQRALGLLRGLRSRFPRGWFAEQESHVNELAGTAQRRSDEAREFMDQITRLENELATTRTSRTEAARDATRSEHGLKLVQQYYEDHEQHVPIWRTKRDAEASDAVAARDDATKLDGEATRLDAEAEEASSAASAAAGDAREFQLERRGVRYVGEGAPPTGGALESLRDEYHRLRRIYEEKVGEEGLSLLHERESEHARAQRHQLATVLRREGVDESDVKETLGTLDHRAAEDRRARAGEEQSSAMGSVGNLTQSYNREDDACKGASSACREIGATPFPADALPLGPNQAEEEARLADATVERYEETARAHDVTAEQGASAAGKLRRTGQNVAGAREQLRTLADAYADAVELGAQSASTAVWTAPADDQSIEAVRALEFGLKATRRDNQQLDDKCSKITQEVRTWAVEPRFEALQSVVGRKLAAATASELEATAADHVDQLELRCRMIEQQVASIDEHRDLLVTQALEAAGEGLQLFKSTATFSRLPAHLPGLGGKQFLRITTHEPDDPAERRSRVAALVDELCDSGSLPTGLTLVQRAVRRIARPIHVSVLHPDPATGRERVEIPEMARFSGGEQLTAAILLYCTLAQLRARTRGVARQPSSVLVLDNPIGRASRVQFLELQREVARAMRVQLVYTTGVRDFDAIATLPNVIRLRNARIDRNTGHGLVEREEDIGGQLDAVRIARVERTSVNGEGNESEAP